MTVGLTTGCAEGLLCLAADGDFLLKLAAKAAIGGLEGADWSHGAKVARVGIAPGRGLASGHGLERAVRRLVRQLPVVLIEPVADRAAKQATQNGARGNRRCVASDRGCEQAPASGAAKAADRRSRREPTTTTAANTTTLAASHCHAEQHCPDQHAPAPARGNHCYCHGHSPDLTRPPRGYDDAGSAGASRPTRLLCLPTADAMAASCRKRQANKAGKPARQRRILRMSNLFLGLQRFYVSASTPR